jgi:hypothetical protein
MAADRVADMTKDELREFIRETVREMLEEYEETGDPDEGLELRPEVAERLRAALKEDIGQGVTLDDVVRTLGLDD